MNDIKDLKSLQEQIQAALIATTRTTGQISSEDLPFHRSLDRSVGTALDEQSARLLSLSGALLKSAASLAGLRVPILEDSDDLENDWRGVVDVVDSLLEKTDTSLDEYTGVRKRKDSPLEDQKSKSSKNPSQLGNAFRTQNILKPQLAFTDKPNNEDKSPWKPLLKTKPHAIQPLEKSLSVFNNDFDQKQYDYTDFIPLLVPPPVTSNFEGLSKSQERRFTHSKSLLKNMGSTFIYIDNSCRYKHPYETEILQLEYPNAMYQRAEPILYQPVETTSAIFVDTMAGVRKMLEELKLADVIAVDLEHHDQRSYVGLVSLMQISTREKDWIVDTLKPWRTELQVLNEVFADPNIIKVFHGAFMDIGWLQRDLGLYVVGLFDTYHAARALGYQGGSLAFLLKKFVDFDADKKYQMADWRIRPLPEEMFFYARSDTHFLLYIFDCMRNELIDRSNPDVPDENRLETVLQKSKEVSLIRHERQVYNAETGKGPGGWFSALAKTPNLYSNEQFAVFKAVHEWRDKIARLDDDSTNFIMHMPVLNSLAKHMPTDMQTLLSLLHPISHAVKSRAGELLEIIRTAKAQGATGPSMVDILRPTTSRSTVQSTAPQSAPKTILRAVEGEAAQSAFWGGAFGSSIWDEPSTEKNDDDFNHFPSYPYPADFITSPGLADRSRRVSESPVHSEPTVPVTADEAFVIKRGAKRKSEGASGESDEDEIALDSDTEQRARKKAKRAERKEERDAKKLRKANAKAAQEIKLDAGDKEDAEEDDDEEEQPFDYSKAESVLKPKRTGTEAGGKQKKKPFDPYAKSADAPHGLRRLQTERAGRSQTFKS